MAKPSFRKPRTEINDGKVNIYSSEKYFTGSIRKTQLITTYGVGSIVDFKDDTVIIASTDSWDYAPDNPEEVESRKIFPFLQERNTFCSPKRSVKPTISPKGILYNHIFSLKSSTVHAVGEYMIFTSLILKNVINAPLLTVTII